MDLPEDLFTTEFSIANEENTAINFDLIMDPITPEHTIEHTKPSTIERALEEVDKYLQKMEMDKKTQLTNQMYMIAINNWKIEYHWKQRVKYKLIAPNPEIKGDRIVLYVIHMIWKKMV